MNNYFERKILPAITFNELANVKKTADAIYKGGLNVMEVAFRTQVAAKAISTIRENFDTIFVGAGTLLTPQQVWEAKCAGAQFGLSPGFNPLVVKEAINVGLPFIPGVMTPSEVERAIESGCLILKLFPADLISGIKMIKALAGPYNHTKVKFIPMGGINMTNLKEYLNLDNIVAVGGSWLATKDLIRYHAYEQIEENVRNALAIVAQQ